MVAQHLHLLETLAERIAARCLQDARVAAGDGAGEKLDVFADARRSAWKSPADAAEALLFALNRRARRQAFVIVAKQKGRLPGWEAALSGLSGESVRQGLADRNHVCCRCRRQGRGAVTQDSPRSGAGLDHDGLDQARASTTIVSSPLVSEAASEDESVWVAGGSDTTWVGRRRSAMAGRLQPRAARVARMIARMG